MTALFLIRTFEVLGMILGLSLGLAGIGLCLRRAFGLREIDIDDVFLSFWTGFGLALLVLIIWNFWLPIGVAPKWIILAIGAAGVLLHGRAWRPLLPRTRWPGAAMITLLIATALYVAHRSLGPFESYDGALYHLQAVAWANAFPAVPGLANLHGPLGFNNGSFLYDAMVNSGWWSGRGYHLANAVLILAWLIESAFRGWRFATADRPELADLFRFVFIVPVVYVIGLNGGITSYSTDVPLTLLLLAATAQMFDFFRASARDERPERRAYTFVALAVLLSAAVCVKATAGVFAAVALPLAAYVMIRDGARSNRWGRRSLAWGTLAVLVFASAWMGRGIILSGYPLFPMTVLPMPVDWRAPLEHARAEMAYLAYTERGFSWKLIGSGWLRLVLLGDPFSVVVPVLVAFTALLGLWRARASWAANSSLVAAVKWMLPPLLVAIIVWFLTAPSTRYCPALFWTLAALSVCGLLAATAPDRVPRMRRLLTAAVIFLAVGPLWEIPILQARAPGESVAHALLRVDLVAPGPDSGFHPVVYHGQTLAFTNAAGTTVNVPVREDGAWRIPNACWDAPLPCTPNPGLTLELREPGRLDRGFRVNGDWAMQDWPYYWDPAFLAEWRRRR